MNTLLKLSAVCAMIMALPSSLLAQKRDTIIFEKDLMRVDRTVEPNVGYTEYSQRNDGVLSIHPDQGIYNFEIADVPGGNLGLANGVVFLVQAYQSNQTGKKITYRFSKPVNIHSFSFTEADPKPYGSWMFSVTKGNGRPVTIDSGDLNVSTGPNFPVDINVSRLIEPVDWVNVTEFTVTCLDSDAVRYANTFTVILDDIIFSQANIRASKFFNTCQSSGTKNTKLSMEFSNYTNEKYTLRVSSDDQSVMKNEYLSLSGTSMDTGKASYPSIVLEKFPNAGNCNIVLTAVSATDSFDYKFPLTVYPAIYGDTQKITSCGPYLLRDSLLRKSGIYFVRHVIPPFGCDSFEVFNLNIVAFNDSVDQFGSRLTALDTSATFQWLNCSKSFEPISGATEHVFLPTEIGTYAVELSKNNCKDTSVCIAVNELSHEDISFAQIKIFPNPANSKVFIVSNGEVKIEQTELRNIMGQTLEKRSDLMQTKVEQHLEQPGVYFLTVMLENGSSKTYKILNK